MLLQPFTPIFKSNMLLIFNLDLYKGMKSGVTSVINLPDNKRAVRVPCPLVNPL